MDTTVQNQVILFITVIWIVCVTQGKVDYKVRCSPTQMSVDITKTEEVTSVYLEKLKGYPVEECQAVVEGHKATFHLSLENIFTCGTTRVVNKLTGRRVFYHRVVVEYGLESAPKEVLLVKCDMGLPTDNATSHNGLSKRDVLPPGFAEPDDLVIREEIRGQAPVPNLSVHVRQNGKVVDTQLNVQPGTPLQMEIYLDSKSAGTYGLLVSNMDVTDTLRQEEIIILNGCSVDPYLFENFNSADGDFLSAKFRAFKFPESSYVLFKGTVNVCLDTCHPVECSNNQLGYGRRKRAVTMMPADPNKIFEITMTTFIKVDNKDGILYEKGIIRNDGAPKNNEALTGRSASPPKPAQEVEKTQDKKELLEYMYFETNKNTASSRYLCFPLSVLTTFILMKL